MTMPRKDEWTQVIMRRTDHALLRRMGGAKGIPMGTVVHIAILDLARKWKVPVEDVPVDIDELDVQSLSVR